MGEMDAARPAGMSAAKNAHIDERSHR